jgi:uncharacterized membrane protein YhaH (DUF805 family)
MKDYVNFEGRAHRTEYWMFFLVYFVVYIVLAVVDVMLGLGFLALIWGLAHILPLIAAAVRRFHDQDKSGWFFLLVLIPLVGGIIVLVFMCLPGTQGANQYGPDPLQGGSA